MNVIINKHDNNIVYMSFDDENVFLEKHEITHSQLKKKQEKYKINDLINVAAKLTGNEEYSKSNFILPGTPLSDVIPRTSYLSNYPYNVSLEKIIIFFEEKEYRVEKKEALITLTLFLSKKIKRELLGVTLTVNQLASIMKMSTRRISDSIAELSALGLVRLETRKLYGISLSSIVLIEYDFFLTFFDGFTSEDRDENILKIEEIKHTHVNSKDIKTNQPSVDPIEKYFAYLTYSYELKRELLELVRKKETHNKIKEHIYALLSH